MPCQQPPLSLVNIILSPPSLRSPPRPTSCTTTILLSVNGHRPNYLWFIRQQDHTPRNQGFLMVRSHRRHRPCMPNRHHNINTTHTTRQLQVGTPCHDHRISVTYKSQGGISNTRKQIKFGALSYLVHSQILSASNTTSNNALSHLFGALVQITCLVYTILHTEHLL